MNWVDILTIGVMLVVVIIFCLRGREAMGAALYDMIALVMAAWVAHTFNTGLAALLNISRTAANIGLFVLVGAILIFVATRLFSVARLEFAPFDIFMSFLFGIVAAWALAYVILESIVIGVPRSSDTAIAVVNSRAATEILEFRTLRGGKALLDSARFHERDPWEQPAPYKQK